MADERRGVVGQGRGERLFGSHPGSVALGCSAGEPFAGDPCGDDQRGTPTARSFLDLEVGARRKPYAGPLQLGMRRAGADHQIGHGRVLPGVNEADDPVAVAGEEPESVIVR